MHRVISPMRDRQAIMGNLPVTGAVPGERTLSPSGHRSQDSPQVTADNQPFDSEIPAAAVQGVSYGDCIHL